MSSVPGFPIDVSQRMGMSNLIPGTGMLQYGHARPHEGRARVRGPGRLDGAEAPAKGGRRAVGFTSLAPTSLQNLAKSVDMFQTGPLPRQQGAAR
jgi:hypothetical protein